MDKLSRDIEALDDTDLDIEDFERVIKGNSKEAFEMRRKRKETRYILYRIQKEFLGGPAAPEGSYVIKEKFEKDPMFNGWRWFSITWDVALDDPERIVRRDISAAEEWEQIVKSKFPVINTDGSVHYPDITVKEKMRKAQEEIQQQKGE